MTSFVENKELVAMTIILLLLSILCKFITGIFLNTLIREAENMSSTENKVLKQCKIKFRNCYKLNDGVPNIPVFVDKFLEIFHGRAVPFCRAAYDAFGIFCRGGGV